VVAGAVAALPVGTRPCVRGPVVAPVRWPAVPRGTEA